MRGYHAIIAGIVLVALMGMLAVPVLGDENDAGHSGEGVTPPEGTGETGGNGEGVTPPEGTGETGGNGEGTTPPEGTGETGGNGEGTTPPEGTATTGGTGDGTTPPEGAATTGGTGDGTTPPEGTATAGGTGDGTTPPEGTATTGGTGDGTTPPEGTRTSGGTGEGTTPPEGTETTGGTGDGVTPPEGTETTGENTDAEMGVVTLGLISVTATGTELTPGGGNGYLFTGTYGDGQITINGAGANAGQYYLREDLHASSSSFAIQINCADVTLDGNGFSVIKNGASGGAGISITADGITIQGFDGTNPLSEHEGISGFSAGIGIESGADRVIITGNTMNNNGNWGINCDGDRPTITGNTMNNNGGNGFEASHMTGGSYDTNDAIITGNTMNNNGQSGILLAGDRATITGNTANNNGDYGIDLDGPHGTITGNTVKNNEDSGMWLSEGDGDIYNNYLANSVNVKGSGDLGTNDWTNPAGPTPGTNVMGGPNIAGNYWSNPTGTGWSDTHDPSAAGYTTDPYHVGGTAYDTAPLVRTPSSAPQTGSSSATQTGSSPPGTRPSSKPGIQIVITSASLATGAAPGTTTDLTLTLENKGTTVLSTQAHIVLTPVNDQAKLIGEQPTKYADGKYTLTFPILIPTKPGVYAYIFRPFQITKDPVTSEEVRIPAGESVQFDVTKVVDGIPSVNFTLSRF